MEGVADFTIRELLSSIGGIDICVTEFIRVTDHVLPSRVFYRLCPELLQNSQTAHGTPVRVQLLGGQPEPVADNAVKAAQLGACAIDLNFGCPAKTVNKSDGGACLLKEPNRLYNIIKRTREKVPVDLPVTAKMRLGYEDRSLYMDNAIAAWEAGANELIVHARSKVDGYRPPAYWDAIAEINEHLDIPVVANGEIWTINDYLRCREVTGCNDFMLGRGLFSCPDLALQIKAHQQGQELVPLRWAQLVPMLDTFFQRSCENYPEKHMGNRLKQWLNYLQRNYVQAEQLFNTIKRSKDKAFIEEQLNQSTLWKPDLRIQSHCNSMVVP